MQANMAEGQKQFEVDRGLYTSKQSMSIILLQDTTDSRDVLDSKLEHHELHRRLAHDVEVLQETANQPINFTPSDTELCILTK